VKAKRKANLTSFCPLRNPQDYIWPIPESTAVYMENTMVTNEKIITINRPVEEVFAYVGDAGNGPKWQSALVEASRMTEGPLGVGTKFKGVRKFMGRKMESVMHYTTYEPNKKVVFRSDSGSMPFVQTFLFEPVAGGTRLTARLDLLTSGLMGLAQPLIASGVKREVDENFSILKDILESRGKPVSE
jgi:uncharacterized protein YndB with AHSA1/START domain